MEAKWILLKTYSKSCHYGFKLYCQESNLRNHTHPLETTPPPPPTHLHPPPHPLPTTWVSFVFRNHRVNIYRAVKGGWILLTRVVGIHCRADGTYSRVSFQEERLLYTLILDFHGDITKTVRWYCILKQWLSPHPHTTENEPLQDAYLIGKMVHISGASELSSLPT